MKRNELIQMHVSELVDIIELQESIIKSLKSNLHQKEIILWDVLSKDNPLQELSKHLTCLKTQAD